MNKIANPFVSLILRSPFHGWMSAALLLISYRGRKSGREFTLPVQYIQEGNRIYVVPAFAEKKIWWRNLKDGADVNITLKGRTKTGRGILLEREADAAEILKAFELYLQRFPPLTKIHNVRLEADGSPNANDLRDAVKTILMIRLELNEGNSQ